MSNPVPDPGYRRLTRSHDNMIGGVCAGVADYLHLDPTLVRVVAVVLAIFTFPVTPLVYLLCWAIIPRD